MKFKPYDVMDIAVYVINKTIDKGKPVNEPTLQNLLKQVQLTFVNLKGVKCFNGGEGLIDDEVKILEVFEAFNKYTKRTIPYQESYKTLVVDGDLEVSYQTNYYCELVIREEDKKLIDRDIDKYIQKDNKKEVNLIEKLDIIKQSDLTTVREDRVNIKNLIRHKHLYEALVCIKQYTMKDVTMRIPFTRIKISSEVNLDIYNETKVSIVISYSGETVLRYSIYSDGYIGYQQITSYHITEEKEAEVIRKVSKYTDKNPEAFIQHIGNRLDKIIDKI